MTSAVQGKTILFNTSCACSILSKLTIYRLKVQVRLAVFTHRHLPHCCNKDSVFCSVTKHKDKLHTHKIVNKAQTRQRCPEGLHTAHSVAQSQLRESGPQGPIQLVHPVLVL